MPQHQPASTAFVLRPDIVHVSNQHQGLGDAHPELGMLAAGLVGCMVTAGQHPLRHIFDCRGRWALGFLALHGFKARGFFIHAQL